MSVLKGPTDIQTRQTRQTRQAETLSKKMNDSDFQLFRFSTFLVVLGGSGGFKELRKTVRIHSDQVSSKSDEMTPQNRQTDRQTDGRTDRQTDGRTDGQTDRRRQTAVDADADDDDLPPRKSYQSLGNPRNKQKSKGKQSKNKEHQRTVSCS